MTSLDYFWTIPPIQDAIASHLTPSDLVHCIRTNKNFATVFQPFRWRRLYFKDKKAGQAFEGSGAALKYHSFIQGMEIKEQIPLFLSSSLTLQEEDPTSAMMTGGMIPAPNLVQLSIFLRQERRMNAQRLVQVIRTHPSLKILQVSSLLIRLDSFQEFCTVLPDHPSLQELDLTLSGSPTCPLMIQLLQSCCRLKKLKISMFQGLGEDPPFEHVPPRMRVFESSLVEEFEMGPHFLWLDQVVLQFLKHCPRMKKLTTKWKNQDLEGEFAEQYWRTVRESCLEFEELVLDYDAVGTIGGQFFSYEAVARMIRGCSKGRGIGAGANGGGLKRIDLPPFVERVPGVICDAILDPRHASQLRCLQVGLLSLDNFRRVVQTCSGLEVLRLRVLLKEEDSSGQEEGEESRPRQNRADLELDFEPWICQRLQNLSLTIHNHLSHQESIDTIATHLGFFFQGIRPLSQLVHLALHFWSGPYFTLTLDKAQAQARAQAASPAILSGMTHLDTLQQLKSFTGEWDHDLRHLRGTALEEIVDQWPRLVRIKIRFAPTWVDPEVRVEARVEEQEEEGKGKEVGMAARVEAAAVEVLKRERLKDYWDEFQDRRPWLEVSGSRRDVVKRW